MTAFRSPPSPTAATLPHAALRWPEALAEPGGGGRSAPSLWRIDLHAPLPPGGLDLLSPAERARHDRFVFPDDRARFAAAHVAVRQLLGAATGVPPDALVFDEGPHGKPRLVGPTAARHGAFNLSHGHDIGLLLWAPAGGDWGVDVERLRPVADAEAIARRVFTPGEFAAWRASPPTERDRRFLQLWTRKEACLKAIGSGFAVEPHRFEAGLDDGPLDVALPTPEGGVARVRLSDLDAGPDAAAALACIVPRSAA